MKQSTPRYVEADREPVFNDFLPSYQRGIEGTGTCKIPKKPGNITALIKRFATRLPNLWQSELKRIHYARQISKNLFETTEPEFKILHKLINSGDWVVDIGANVGHYTKRFSELVGKSGRVIAFEPVPATFALLAANVQLFAHSNVTLINTAVSDRLDVAGMSIPQFPTGLSNYYQAHLSSSLHSLLSVLTVPLDSICINQHIALVKIDVEGHESFVLAGMRKLFAERHPILIVETDSKEIIDNLSSLGYLPVKFHDSPNILFKPAPSSR